MKIPIELFSTIFPMIAGEVASTSIPKLLFPEKVLPVTVAMAPLFTSKPVVDSLIVLS